LSFIVVNITIAIIATMNDNEGMKTFDSIEVHRPDLAASYLKLLQAQPGRPLALFAPRRVGKTFFLDNDLSPIAVEKGMLPVYADVWLQRHTPLDAINHALEEALDDLLVPEGSVKKIGKTPVKKLGAVGASIEFGDEPKRRTLPEEPALRLDALVTRVAKTAGKQVLLLLDEIQALGDAPQGESIIAALRAVLHKRKHEVAAVFTGSSQVGLSRLMSTAGAPMYQFAQLLDFPVLGDEFLEQLAHHFAQVHKGRSLNLDHLKTLFARLGHKPALMKDIIKSMSVEGETDVNKGVERFLKDDHQVAGWHALVESLSPLEQGVLRVIAKQLPPFAKDTLNQLAEKKQTPSISKVRSALERLRKLGILTKDIAGGIQLEDRLMGEYLVRREMAETTSLPAGV
jgi:uncharacterized protein